jgi:hypothetical protein
MNKNKCRHRDSWLIASGLYEWCYVCGSLRMMKLSMDESICGPATQWTRPTGDSLKNPYPMKPLNLTT